MGIICIHSGCTGSGTSNTSVFIQCNKDQNSMSNKLWYHELGSLSHNIRHTARVDIPPRTDRAFITEYLTTDGGRIIIIGQSSGNKSIQITDISLKDGVLF